MKASAFRATKSRHCGTRARGKDINRRRVRAAIAHADLDQNVGWCLLRVFNEDIEVAILVENAGGARRREFHEDRGARICILAGRRPPKPDTFEADGSTAELNKPLADGAGHTFSTAPSARAQKSWVRISMPRRQISRP